MIVKFSKKSAKIIKNKLICGEILSIPEQDRIGTRFFWYTLSGTELTSKKIPGLNKRDAERLIKFLREKGGRASIL